MPILNLILALVVPWILGFAIVRACLNRRYGYRAFALGFGYVLGFFITQLLFRLYTYIGRDFVFYEIIGAELALALLLLFFCKARLCSIDELRIERKLPNTLRLLVLLIFVFYWFVLPLFLSMLFHAHCIRGMRGGHGRLKLKFSMKILPLLIFVI